MKTTDALGRVLAAGTVAAVIGSGIAWATAGSGTTSTVVGPRATFAGFELKRKGANDWEVELEAKHGLDIATQTIIFQPTGQSGWHTHPGPVFISVKEGTMTFYDHNCNPTVRVAGQGFLDTGSEPHLARNESGAPATNVVTYFLPPGAPGLRIDEPQPLNCPL